MSDHTMPAKRYRVVATRKESEAERELRVFWDKVEAASIDNLEAGARQIIQLVTLFFGVVFGILALGKEEVAPHLAQPVVVGLWAAAMLLLLLALAASLLVVLPRAYHYQPGKPKEQQVAYELMLARKQDSLKIAVSAFGLGMAAFVGLMAALVYFR